MDSILHIDLLIQPDREGTYFTLPFQLDREAASLTITYHYDRYANMVQPAQNGEYHAQPEINIIDLGLIAPDGSQVGASGSDKTEIQISETHATPGYNPCRLMPGEWQILVGAYKVAPEGCRVSYDIRWTSKEMQLLKGDLHVHTVASDGVCTPAELGQRVVRHGMDFLAITDHNQMIARAALPQIPGLTMIPGIEWTHYQGHANFLGIDQPYDEPFATNTVEDALARFQSARRRGALITINHPLDTTCGFQFDLNTFPFDCLEVWNGPMRESNLRAVGLWQSLLSAGRKIPICGGSDYHRDTPFIFPGGPTTCIHAMSPGISDILDALRKGHGYIVFAPNGPTLTLNAGDAMVGDTVAWSDAKQIHIRASGLQAGDVLRMVTATGADVLLQAPAPGFAELDYPMQAPGFARVEILRSFLPGIPMLPALLSNPVYFED